MQPLELASVGVFLALPFSAAWIIFSFVGLMKEAVFGLRQGYFDWTELSCLPHEKNVCAADSLTKVHSFGKMAAGALFLLLLAFFLVFLGPVVFLWAFPYLKPVSDSVFLVYIVILSVCSFGLASVIKSRSADEVARISRHGIDLGKFYSGPFRRSSFWGQSIFPRKQLMLPWSSIEKVFIDDRVIPVPKLIVLSHGSYYVKHIGEHRLAHLAKKLTEQEKEKEKIHLSSDSHPPV